jgi:hypothetical protein
MKSSQFVKSWLVFSWRMATRSGRLVVKVAKKPLKKALGVTEISSIIMTAALKKMHGTVLSVAKMDFKTALT